jgi:putative transposase
MSAAISPATSQNYGVQRVCRIWGLPRSSFYHAAALAQSTPAAAGQRPRRHDLDHRN